MLPIVPAPPIFSLELRAVEEDVDLLGHVSNIRYVDWLQRVASAHSEAAGFDVAAYREVGGIFVVRRHEIDYLRPAYAGDRIRLETWIASWKMASSVRMTSVLRIADAQGRVDSEPVELARGFTRWAFVNFASGRPMRIPEVLKNAFPDPVERSPAGR